MTAWTVPSYAEWSVPGYTEERLLGHGVSGRVVAAVNDDGQRVAIKYLHENLVRDTEFLGELRSEAEQLVSLNAPHMVRVFDYVEQPGEGAAIVMELVDGVSLREMLARSGPLGVAAALVVLKDSLLALAAAHSHRLPHRDVKPDNVLIDARGWCTLTDFGVAVKTDKQMLAPGTPEYMAPELWHGAPNVPTTDIYAATAVLCESLTGKPPFTGRAGRLRDQHESTPVPLDEFDPPLQDLIAWGLAKDPAARPRNAMSFVSELDARAAAAYGPYWEDQGRRELAEREAELLPLLAGGAGGGSARVNRLARRKMLAFVSVAAVAIVALGAAGFVVLTKTSGTHTQLSSVSADAVGAQITATPPVAASKCTTPTTFTFTASITDVQPGPISYQWLYSSGKPGPVQTLNFIEAGEKQVRGSVTTSMAGDGWAQLKLLLNPGAKTSDKATYQLLCSTANSDIALSATVKPAALAFSSCSAPHPTLTATGTITSKNPGTVSFYWAMSNGEKTTPVQLTFNSPGTQAANPLTFPAWVPASGDVVLVVTKPAVAASKPAAYKVTCGAAPGGPAPATSPAATRSSAKPSVAPSTAAPTSATTSPTAAPTTSSPAPTTSSPTPTPTTPSPTPTTASPTPTLPTVSVPPTTLPVAPTP